MSGFAPPPSYKTKRRECDTCHSTRDVITRADGIQKCGWCRRNEFVLDRANHYLRTRPA